LPINPLNQIFYYVFPKNAQKLSFWAQVPNFGKQNNFGCSMLVWKDVGKISEFLLCGLQDISVWIDKNPYKKPGSYTSQGHIFMKKYPKWWVLFGIILQSKLATCLKKFRSFGIVEHIKKIVSRKK